MMLENEAFHLLIVDDDEQIRGMIASVFEDRDWIVDEAENGPEGVEIVRNNPDYYELALLDVMMPGPSGLDVLPELLKYGRNLAIIMMSGYAEVGSAVEAMQNGASDFLEKPIEHDVLINRVAKALRVRELEIENRQYVSDIEKMIAERTSQLEAARKATIFALACLTEYRDEETGHHLERMANYSVALANSLKQMGLHTNILDDTYINLLFESAPLHDIGKVSIPDKILRKPKKLTRKEFEIIKKHTTVGARAIGQIQVKVKGQNFLSIGAEVALSHHEHYDGNGYPDGLVKDDIPVAARIVALADFYDALSFPRIYRPFAFPHEEVIKMITDRSGTQFDPDVVRSFIGCKNQFESLRRQFQN